MLPTAADHLNIAELVPHVYCLAMTVGGQGAKKRAEYICRFTSHSFFIEKYHSCTHSHVVMLVLGLGALSHPLPCAVIDAVYVSPHTRFVRVHIAVDVLHETLCPFVAVPFTT